MCAGTRSLASGQRLEHQQCPSTREDYQKNLIAVGRMYPEMTLSYLSYRINKSVWWIFEKLLFDPPVDAGYPKLGDQYLTLTGESLTVQRADKFAVHWTDGTFSLYEDLRGMKYVTRVH